MRVEVPAALLQDPAHQGPLLAMFLMGLHVWRHRFLIIGDVLDDRARPVALGDWVQKAGLSEGLRRDLLAAFDEWARQEVDPVCSTAARGRLRLQSAGETVWSTDAAPTRAMPSEALVILSRPFEIWVENAINDRAFVLALCLAEHRRLLEDWEKEGLLRFVHGSGVPGFIDVVRAAMNAKPASLRSALVFDSDRGCPADLPADAPSKMARLANHYGIPFWCLRRRCIENYLPEQSLQRFSNTESLRVTLSAWRKLTPDARSFVNMKKGIQHDRGKNQSQSAVAKAFWAAVSEDIVTEFGSGFGRSLASEAFQQVSADNAAAFDSDAREEARQAMLRILEVL